MNWNIYPQILGRNVGLINDFGLVFLKNDYIYIALADLQNIVFCFYFFIFVEKKYKVFLLFRKSPNGQKTLSVQTDLGKGNFQDPEIL